MRIRRLHAFAALIVLAAAGPAFAVDSLTASPRGDDKTFTIYYLHSIPDGTTVVEEKTAAVTSRVGGAGRSDILFDGALDNVSIRWSPDGNQPPKDAPPNHEKKARLQLVLQGEFAVEVSNGKEVHVKQGNLLLQEDSTGFGHKMRCTAPTGSLGCVQRPWTRPIRTSSSPTSPSSGARGSTRRSPGRAPGGPWPWRSGGRLSPVRSLGFANPANGSGSGPPDRPRAPPHRCAGRAAGAPPRLPRD